MADKVFNWTDIYRIARSVFGDVPETSEEIRSWTGTILFMASSVYGIIRAMENSFLRDPSLFDGVYFMLQDSVDELMKSVSQFPQHRKKEFLEFVEGLVKEMMFSGGN